MFRLVLMAGACWLAYSIGRQRSGSPGEHRMSGVRNDDRVDSDASLGQGGSRSGGDWDASRSVTSDAGVILTPDARV